MWKSLAIPNETSNKGDISRRTNTDESLEQLGIRFIGLWIRITNLPCSMGYPTQIEFRKNGLYWGTGSKSAPSPGWDVGTWQLASLSEVKISTAHDAIMTYKFSLKNDLLTFIDPAGCEFKYRREEG